MTVAGEAARAGRWRRPVAQLLTIVGVLLVVVSVASNYVERQALDTDNFKTMAEQLIDDPAIKQQVAQSLTDQLFTSVDVQAQLEQCCRPTRRARRAAHRRTQTCRRAVGDGDPRPAAVPEDLGRRADGHAEANRAHPRRRDQFLQTDNGAVVIDLRQLLKELAEQLPISPGLAAQIPPDKGDPALRRAAG